MSLDHLPHRPGGEVRTVVPYRNQAVVPLRQRDRRHSVPAVRGSPGGPSANADIVYTFHCDKD